MDNTRPDSMLLLHCQYATYDSALQLPPLLFLLLKKEHIRPYYTNSSITLDTPRLSIGTT